MKSPQEAAMVRSYVHKAQAFNVKFPGTFNDEQMFILEAVWDNWTWNDLVQGLKIRFNKSITKDQARKLGKKTVVYLNSFSSQSNKFARNETINQPETMRKVL